MKKEEKLRDIIERLLVNQKFNNYSKQDIEKAIFNALEPLDQRTVDKWFTLLWKLEYIVQPHYGTFALNISNIQKLDVKFPEEIDPKQTRLE